jgi:hypothetical protein
VGSGIWEYLSVVVENLGFVWAGADRLARSLELAIKLSVDEEAE